MKILVSPTQSAHLYLKAMRNEQGFPVYEEKNLERFLLGERR